MTTQTDLLFVTPNTYLGACICSFGSLGPCLTNFTKIFRYSNFLGVMAPLHQRKTMKTSLRPEKIEELSANVVKLK